MSHSNSTIKSGPLQEYRKFLHVESKQAKAQKNPYSGGLQGVRIALSESRI